MIDLTFQIGDMVYASDWCYGEIVDIDRDKRIAYVEFDTCSGGGCLPFDFDELKLDFR